MSKRFHGHGGNDSNTMTILGSFVAGPKLHTLVVLILIEIELLIGIWDRTKETKENVKGQVLQDGNEVSKCLIDEIVVTLS